MTADDPATRRGRRTFYLLVLIFFGPLLLSFVLYYFSEWRPAGQNAHGELISPARPLAGAPPELKGDEWALVTIADAACESQACRDTLVFGRQTRLSLNQDMQRVRRVLLATDHCCTNDYLAREQEGLLVVDASTPAGRALVAQVPPADREHSVYVVDPLGNLVMRYDSREEPKGLLTDLKKLLKLSHIG
jgi:hypothetical protein